ncbi:MAG: 50S ribosomal protein L20 [Phycisphaera sp.]|nr:MAG: 50S ribosomal protein L20 [Phycisphaera sp.]
MPRVRIGSARNRSRKRILRGARGYYGARKNHRYLAKDAIIRGGAFAYAHRRLRKRDMRKLWITRITAACKMRGTRYSVVINGLKLSGITLNRKMLSQIAIEDPKLFDTLVETALKNTTAGNPGEFKPAAA